MDFDVHGREPSVQHLAVHEENFQTITFNENRPEEAIANARDTTLLAWFKLNQNDSKARSLKYHEIPEHYVWNAAQHKWTKRKQGRSIGHMYTTNPSQGERHYLRILLHHKAGATSYIDLKTSTDGVIHKTFKETALVFGLLETDEEWDECLSEAATSFMPKQLHSLFVTILIFGQPAKPNILWEKHKEVMGEDIWRDALTSLTIALEELRKDVDNEVLILLQRELETMGTSLEAFGLPAPQSHRITKIPAVIQEELFDTNIQKDISKRKCQSLNADQQNAFSIIMQAVHDEKCSEKMFFLNAPGGYGKTFLIEALLSTVRAMGEIALAVASSGIAAELLQGGRTAHSRFKIPIPVNENSTCSISLQSNEAELLRRVSLIIWDEIMISHVHHVGCVDRSLRDICKIDQPFGGVVVVFAGDPRQILPVVWHGNRSDIVHACIHSSLLWKHTQQIQLSTNMRVAEDEIQFSSYLITIGNGTAEVHAEVGEDMIQIPREYLVDTLDELINSVFPQLEEGYADKYFVSKRAILTPVNENVDRINELIMDRFPGEGKVYLSADSVAEEDLQNAYPTDFLNSVTLFGMPPHSMTLKVGAPVMLLRNLRAGPGNGLWNGT